MAIPIETNNPEASNLHINITIVKPEIHQLIIDSMMTHNNTDNPEDSSDEDEV
ncbi:14294_t:CDS:2 [Entrophospora sp. SA101]|nr:14294_t:CDS:2 [Entrophospora sp. SA101]